MSFVFDSNSKKDTEYYSDPRGYMINIHVKDDELNFVNKINKGFQPKHQIMKQHGDFDISQAYVIKIPRTDPPEFDVGSKYVEIEGDGYYDEWTGLILTTNECLDTWGTVANDFKLSLIEKVKKARENNQDLVSQIKDGFISIIPITEKGNEVMKSFNNNISTQLMRSDNSVCLSIIRNITDATQN